MSVIDAAIINYITGKGSSSSGVNINTLQYEFIENQQPLYTNTSLFLKAIHESELKKPLLLVMNNDGTLEHFIVYSENVNINLPTTNTEQITVKCLLINDTMFTNPQTFDATINTDTSKPDRFEYPYFEFHIDLTQSNCSYKFNEPLKYHTFAEPGLGLMRFTTFNHPILIDFLFNHIYPNIN